MSSKHFIDVALKALAGEALASSIYNRLGQQYREDGFGAALTEIAGMEEEHVGYWTAFLRKRGRDPSRVQVGRVTLALHSALMRLLGPGLTLRLLEMRERDAVDLYTGMMGSGELGEGEAEGLRKILEDELVHEHELMMEESRFGGLLSHLREAVLGMNDGLVEILSATTGLAGVYGAPLPVALGGLIVGVAGGLSMGISTYASARAQRQVHEGILRRISTASRFVAHVFRERVAKSMINRGYSGGVSEALAEESSKDGGLLAEFIAENEYGLRREALGKPLRAGLYAGFFNILGAFVPLMPYFFVSSIISAVILSVLFAAATLAVTGFLIGVLANLSVKKKVSEMMISGLGSAGATYLIGRVASLLLGGVSLM